MKLYRARVVGVFVWMLSAVVVAQERTVPQGSVQALLPRAPALSRAQTTARIERLPALQQRRREILPAELVIVALTDATTTGASCTGSRLECLHWFRVEERRPGTPTVRWRIYGVDPMTGAVCRTTAMREAEITTARCVP